MVQGEFLAGRRRNDDAGGYDNGSHNGSIHNSSSTDRKKGAHHV
jgi:hypothetical protein